MSSSRLKSSLKGSANGIGIDFTHSAFSAICLNRESGFLSIAGTASGTLSIDDEEEMAHALKKLTRSTPSHKAVQNVCLAVPPLAATELMHIIPETLPNDALDAIVKEDVSQIVSTSDVEFINDFQVMNSCIKGRKNAIICLARSNTVEEYCETLRQYQFKSHKVTSHNLALASAFFALHTKISESATPQVLLCMEEESTAMTIVCNGGVQFSTWLSFGTRNLEITLNRKERNGRQILKDEFENAVSRWHELLIASISEQRESPEAIKALTPDNVWYSGPLDATGQFSEMLQSILPDANIGAFGIPGNMLPTPDDTLHTELTIAFGLALQSIGESHLSISLTPERLKWIERRESEYCYLALSSVSLVFGMIVLLFGILMHLNRSIAALNNEAEDLRECSKLIPQLEKYHDRMTFYQKKMLPPAEALHRTHRILEVLTLWNEAEKNGDPDERSWGIFLADEASFNRSNQLRETPEPPRMQTPARQSNTSMDLFASEPPKPTASPRVNIVDVNDLKILKSMYIGGIVPLGKSRYKTVKDLQTQLVDSGVYVNVDDHSDSLSQRFTDNYYAPWINFLEENSDALQSEYTTFLMQLPFKEEFIRAELLQPEKPRNRK
ncbi:MAG: hypothetical protein IJS15_11090 [Victivallales bacterium]|nr:hypothetical protein [Victivallales bacterium]